MYRLKLVPNQDGTYNLYISLDRNDTELAEEFLSEKKDKKGRRNILDSISKKYKNIKIKTVVVLFPGVMIAYMPFNVFAMGSASNTAESSVSHTVSQNKKFNMSYLYGGTVSQQIDMAQTMGSLNVVSPSWFDINGSGKLVLNNASTQLVDSMHKMGIKVVPMLSNHWDRTGGKLALENPDSLAQQIAMYVEQYNLDGVNVDIENVTHTERDEYTQLVKRLRELIPQEKEVSVAVAANPNGWTTGWHGSYDYAELSKYADYLMIMAYDESWQGSEAGPVASYDFVKKSVEYALKYADSDKIVLGIPFYGRLWSNDGTFKGNGVGLDVLSRMFADYDATITYDEAKQSPKATFTVKQGDPSYTVGGKKLTQGTYTVWFEDSRSIQSKIQLIHDYDLKGAGSWALNQATDEILKNFSSWLENPNAGGSGSQTQTKQGRVTAYSLRVRSQPNTQSQTLAYYSEGDIVTIVGEENGWYKVKLPSGSYGYVSADYVEIIDDSESQTRTAYCSGSGVRVRSGASTSHSILAHLSYGEQVTVTGNAQNGWYPVTTQSGVKGYVSGEYITFTKPQTSRTGYSTASGVRVRSGASTSHTILTHLSYGEQVTVTGDAQNGWYPVTTQNGVKGYVSGEYITFTKPQTNRTGYCTASGVRVRSGASTSHTILTHISYGEEVTVTGSAQNGWYPVTTQSGVKGYVSGEYITFTKPQINRTAYCTGSRVRVRSGASTSHSILTHLSKGERVTVTGNAQNGWYPVTTQSGVKGYVSGEYLSF